MKLLRCDGRTLEVRDVGPVIYRLLAGTRPIKQNGWSIVDDGEARAILRAHLVEGAVSDRDVSTV